jgi:acyl carrier protein
MSQSDLLSILKDVVVAAVRQGDPSADPVATRARMDSTLTVDAPLADLGFDSLKMTWILVRLEERLLIDTSCLSLFDLFTVGDLLRELEGLVTQKAA